MRDAISSSGSPAISGTQQQQQQQQQQQPDQQEHRGAIEFLRNSLRQELKRWPSQADRSAMSQQRSVINCCAPSICSCTMFDVHAHAGMAHAKQKGLGPVRCFTNH
jgi:hypothetical protein